MENIRMFSCRWWAWTAELRTRTKQSYPCSSRNLNQSSWVRSQRHGHFQKSFLDVFAIPYSWYCASAFYIPIYWRLLPISISMQTHISLFCTLTYYICSASLSWYYSLVPQPTCCWKSDGDPYDMKVDFIMHITSNCLVLITMITNLCSPGIFTVEMCAKIFAMGFICHENSYLRYCQCTYAVKE